MPTPDGYRSIANQFGAGTWPVGVLDSSRGFMLVGIITAIFATLCCLDSFLRQASKFFPETNVWAMTCFTAGVCGLISSVMFLMFVLDSPQQPQVQQKYNWAFYMSWAVGPAFALSGIVTLASVLVFRISFSTSGPFHPELNRRYSWAFYVGCVASFLFFLSMAPGLAEKLNFKRLTKVLTCLSLLTELLALVSPYWMEVTA
ncbi:hypothetical protein UY3_19121 [Chelonia mydas]|uniref:Uncharacterized protein n=1 Tax=Chelonia mydas TaxID=8469 RepID=M7AMB5_CHEMY|nr:hypothetical protein UY3_19121 [Chelonia mydas]